MSDAEFKQYRDGARLLFVNQDDYKECKSIIQLIETLKKIKFKSCLCIVNSYFMMLTLDHITCEND